MDDIIFIINSKMNKALDELDYNELIKRIEDSPRLLDVAIMIEDILDSMDIYAYKNWYSGVLVSGPYIKRHWVKMVLEYSSKQMPDPKGALRLLRYGVRTIYTRAKRETISGIPKDSGEYVDNKTRPHSNTPVWLITLLVPRRLIGEITSNDLDIYDEDIEVDDVEDALDAGITTENQLDASSNPDQLGG